MPAKYLAIRNKLVKEGKPMPEAKTQAAKIFNATRKPKQEPVTGSTK
jgi:hypothetical protein